MNAREQATFREERRKNMGFQASGDEARLTEEELREMQERAERATGGPWEYTPNDAIKAWLEPPEDVPGFQHIGAMAYRRDVPFVAHAREDIPKLLAELERTREREAELLEAAKAVMRSHFDVPRRLEEGSKATHDHAVKSLGKAIAISEHTPR